MAPRVLVVEDNPVNLELVAALLESEGCGVILAETADVTLRLAATERPDLIVMDIQLPGMSGHEATRRLKADARTQHIPVVALTDHALSSALDAAREAGCDSFVVKPALPDVVVAEVRRAISGRRQLNAVH